jgi:phosphohistidine phosphatase SixA
MRHLDRIDQPCDALSVRGQEAARRLAAWFANKPLATISTSRFDRAIDTAKPTAALCKVSSSQHDNVRLQIAFAQAAAKPVLVVGNTFSVRRLILGLGGKPPDEDPKSFGRIWTIRSDGQTTLNVLPQEGLPAKGGPCPPGAKLDEVRPKTNLRK